MTCPAGDPLLYTVFIFHVPGTMTILSPLDLAPSHALFRPCPSVTITSSHPTLPDLTSCTHIHIYMTDKQIDRCKTNACKSNDFIFFIYRRRVRQTSRANYIYIYISYEHFIKYSREPTSLPRRAPRTPSPRPIELPERPSFVAWTTSGSISRASSSRRSRARTS